MKLCKYLGLLSCKSAKLAYFSKYVDPYLVNMLTLGTCLVKNRQRYAYIIYEWPLI